MAAGLAAAAFVTGGSVAAAGVSLNRRGFVDPDPTFFEVIVVAPPG